MIIRWIFCLILLPGVISAQTGERGFEPFSVDTAFQVKAHPSGMPGQLELRMFQNDSLVFTNFDSTRKFPVLLYADWHEDTLDVLGNVGMFSGFGFAIRLVADKGLVFNQISTDDPAIFKLQLQDSTYRSGLYIPCHSSKLTLTTLPTYAAGELISGFVELSGKDFFEKNKSDAEDDRYRMEIRSTFQFLVPARP